MIKKIELSIILYILFVYEYYIYQDWNCIKPFAKKILYFFWLIRIFYIVLYSIICLPLVLLHMELIKDKYNKLFDGMFSFINKAVSQFIDDINYIKKII